MSKSQTSKPIVLAVSHCLLNPKVRAEGLSQHPEIKKKILNFAEKYNAEIRQLPCPEFLFLGPREPKTYDEYTEIEGFRDSCGKLAEDITRALKKFKGFSVIVVGIARSPSCSISYVHDKNDKLKKEEGLLMYSLRRKIKAEFTEIDYHDIDASIEKIEKIIETAF